MFEPGQFLGVMRAVGFVVGVGGGLQQTLEFFPLPLLPLDLVPQQGDLAGKLAVGIMGLVGLRLGVANPALDDRLVDRVGLGGLLGHRADQIKTRLIALNIGSLRVGLSYGTAMLLAGEVRAASRAAEAVIGAGIDMAFMFTFVPAHSPTAGHARRSIVTSSVRRCQYMPEPPSARIYKSPNRL